ncbi:MAG TPA: hypothetical protein VEK07_12845 [Polyangiaceae bacterium]|nr:hypothetical protein [Polyangiaceae bacterium]
MKAPVATALAASIVLGAATAALLFPSAAGDGSDPIAASSTVAAPDPAEPAGEAVNGSPFEALPAGHPPIPETASPLPENHPPIGTAAAPADTLGMAPGGSDEPPTITWDVPAGWKTLPNPNAMRVATYRPTADSELLVVRAGGSTDANIRRWIAQFDEPERIRRVRKLVHGLQVETLEASGTYTGGAMMQSAPAQPRPRWTLLGAVVEGTGSHYFFKLVGPTGEVEATHSSFDALIDSIRPL